MRGDAGRCGGRFWHLAADEDEGDRRAAVDERLDGDRRRRGGVRVEEVGRGQHDLEGRYRGEPFRRDTGERSGGVGVEDNK